MTTVNSGEASDSAERARPQSWGDIAVHFAHRIARDNFPRGDRAGLRRMDPDKPDPAVFWRLLAEGGLLDHGETVESKWALVLHGIALMTPTNAGNGAARSAHDGYMPVGRALFSNGYSETRLNRLLTSREAMLRTLLARMFRTLASGGASFNWREMSQFILSDGHDEEEAERARRRIARAYYQAERRNAQGSADDSD